MPEDIYANQDVSMGETSTPMSKPFDMTTYGQDRQPIQNEPTWSMGNDFSPSRFDNGFYNYFEKSTNNNAVRAGLNQAVKQGIDLSTFKKTLDEQKRAYDQLNQEYNQPIGVDRTRLMGLQDQYSQRLANAPMQPQMVQPQVNDTVAGVSALAGLLSPQQMRGRIAMAPFQAAQMGADMQNQRNQQAFQVENQNFGAVMKGLAAQIEQEAEQVKNQYGVEIDKKELLVKRMNDIMDSMTQTQGQMVGAEKAYDANTIRRHTAASTEWAKAISQAGLDGEITQEEYDSLAAILPKFLSDRGIPAELADTYVMPSVGKSQTRLNQDFNQTQSVKKQTDQEIRNMAADGFKSVQSMIRYANMDGKVTEQDRASLSSRIDSMYPSNPNIATWLKGMIPDAGMDWRKAKADADAILNDRRIEESIRHNKKMESQGQSRIDTANNREKRLANGGGEVKRSTKAKNDEVNPWLLHDIGQQGLTPTIGTANSGHGDMTKSGNPSRHKKGNAVDITHINGYAVTTPEGKKLAEQYVANLVKAGYVRNKENGNDMSVLWDMNGHYDHIHVGRKSRPASTTRENPGFGAQSEGGRSSKAAPLGIPINESYASEGSKNPQAQTNPAKSPQNAGKGQSSNTTKSGDTFQFGKPKK